MTVLFILLAISYMFLKDREPLWVRILHKIAPLLVLVFVVMQAKSRLPLLTYWGLIAALRLSMGGDIALNLTEKYRLAFPVGLGLFLLAHVAYVVVFTQVVAELSAVNLLLSISTLLYGLLLTRKLWPNLGSLRPAVLAYVGVIMGMILSAVFHAPFSPQLILGALIFAVSDSLIALDKFNTPIPYRDFLVMGTYYLAQFLIISTFVTL